MYGSVGKYRNVISFLPDPGFVESDDKKRIKCSICEKYGFKDFMGRDGDKKHLSSKAHERNVDADKIRTAALAAVHHGNQAINSALDRLEIPAVQNVVDETVYIPSAEEDRMWGEYHLNGGDFSAGIDTAADEARQQTALARQADQFGRWNATSIARNLGFLAEAEVLDQHDEDDALLCELMDNARTSLFFKVMTRFPMFSSLAGIDAPSVDDLVNDELGQERARRADEWYPYPSKMVMNLQ